MPTTTALVLKGATIAGKGFLAKLRSMTANGKFEKAVKELDDEILHETAAQVAKLEVRVGKLADQLEGKNITALFLRLWREARESTTHERRSMLAAAIAGYLSPEIDVETKERVSLAITVLQPSDVRTLRLLDDVNTAGDDVGTEVNFAALRAAQCIATTPTSYDVIDEHPVTELGRALLAYLRDWSDE